MISLLLPSLVICSIMILLTLANLFVRKRLRQENNELVEAIDALLPQTQCAQCGYPGCRPYAESVAQGESTDLCVPGGPATQTKLAILFGKKPTTRLTMPIEVVALIDEQRCIGCTLCLPACPVDAIIGAKTYMHTVLMDECTGCELCLEACPVDCIELRIRSEETSAPDLAEKTQQLEHQACINCNQCEPVCPVNISPVALHKLIERQNDELAGNSGLAACIECGICDHFCPSEIPLSRQFYDAKSRLADLALERRSREKLLTRFNQHETRLERQTETEKSKRTTRLKEKRSWL